MVTDPTMEPMLPKPLMREGYRITIPGFSRRFFLILARKIPLTLPKRLERVTTVAPSLRVFEKNSFCLFRQAKNKQRIVIPKKTASRRNGIFLLIGSRETVATKEVVTTMSFTEDNIG